MHKFGLLLISAAGMVLAGTAAFADADQTAPAAPAATEQAQPTDQDRVVCRQEAPPTGSRLGSRRICRTQKEWDDIRHQSQDSTNHMELLQANPNSPSGGH